MPVTPSYPGVYVQEVPSGTHTIIGVNTSDTGFVGYFNSGPMNTAVRLLNLGDFDRNFGPLSAISEAGYAIQQYFANGGDSQYFVGSSDWMPRNFDRRVEAGGPIENPSLPPRLASLFEACLRDNRQSWGLGPNGEWTQRRPTGEEEFATQKARVLRS